ncbi:hypothetical protein LCGC14_1124840 [marine sediment metagenome]|uniref:Uncharacterized protein n=1 Tax=marine sediment metagenome TaxID=412755 RepID=A0A0F9M2Y1_9ZZZZ
MALVKYGGGIVQMSGSIAGNTFARNRYGNYSRARTKPINPNTGLQVAIRNAVAEATTRWSQTLTAVQRTAWNLYADSVSMKNKLGESIFLSGFNHYVRSNTTRLRYAIAAIDAGPTTFELPALDPAFSITISEATQLITVAFDDVFAWASEDGAHMAVYQGQPQNAQRSFFNGPWRNAAILFGNSGVPLTTPQDIPVSFVVTEGQHIWVYARISRTDGRLSEKMRADTFCAA